MQTRTTIILALLIVLLSFGSVLAEPQNRYSDLFSPLPRRADSLSNPLNPPKVTLGKMLFFDPRLSRSGVISCNTCHALSTGGVDNLPTSVGHGWQIGGRNAPTVFNAAILETQFWDGRAATVEEQAGGPILNPIEMANTEERAVETIKSIPGYVSLFKKAYKNVKEPVNFTNITKAIAAFERTLLTPSRFDRYLVGKKGGLRPDEIEGLDLFVSKGCVGCHSGIGIGGNSFQRFEYGTDEGRYNVTGSEADRKVFRVPSLRNIERTYPYFHDGSVWELAEAVKIMGQVQLGVELTEIEIDRLVKFLRSLTATRLTIKLPVLPPSSATTPRPEPMAEIVGSDTLSETEPEAHIESPSAPRSVTIQ
jgi:cytochrome c peroxidase